MRSNFAMSPTGSRARDGRHHTRPIARRRALARAAWDPIGSPTFAHMPPMRCRRRTMPCDRHTGRPQPPTLNIVDDFTRECLAIESTARLSVQCCGSSCLGRPDSRQVLSSSRPCTICAHGSPYCPRTPPGRKSTRLCSSHSASRPIAVADGRDQKSVTARAPESVRGRGLGGSARRDNARRTPPWRTGDGARRARSSGLGTPL